MKKWRTYIMLLVFILTVRPACAAITKQEALSNFIAGNQAYKEGNYEKAIESYQSIPKGSRESGPVYYNLGNAYFKSGKLGYAVWSYEKAKRYFPRDSDLNFNVGYAESLIKKKNTQEKSKNFLETMIQNYINFYTIDEMVLFITIFTVLAVAFHLLSKFLKWKNLIRRGVRTLIVFLILINIAGLFIKVSSQIDRAIVIQASNANFEPLEAATPHFELAEGMAVKIVTVKDDWVKVKRDDGLLGWVKQAKLERIE